ncbi:putative uncharacterized protein DDB_G0287457 [Macrobrachium nipponense]|uniref:putative uncharacterized protein DDB_G0287457 n=1 Tax=Macrobrachium nipponense TaxID=159736 RepID=UPI0030C841D2
MYERLTKGRETCGNSVGNNNNIVNNHSVNSNRNNNNNNVNSINAGSEDSSGGGKVNTGVGDAYIPLNVQRSANFPMNAKTFIPPPPLAPIGDDGAKKKKGEPLILNVLNSEVTCKRVNPDLTSVIPILFKDHQIPYVTSLVNHLQNSGAIEWNEEGDQSHPLNGYNILDVAREFQANKRMDDSNIPSYNYLIEHGGISEWMVRNTTIKRQIEAWDNSVKKGGSRTMKNRVAKKKGDVWLPY